MEGPARPLCRQLYYAWSQKLLCALGRERPESVMESIRDGLVVAMTVSRHRVSRKAQEFQNLRSGKGVGDKDPKSTRKEQEAKTDHETVGQEARQGQGGAPKSYKCGLVQERGRSVW